MATYLLGAMNCSRHANSRNFIYGQKELFSTFWLTCGSPCHPLRFPAAGDKLAGTRPLRCLRDAAPASLWPASGLPEAPQPEEHRSDPAPPGWKRFWGRPAHSTRGIEASGAKGRCSSSTLVRTEILRRQIHVGLVYVAKAFLDPACMIPLEIFTQFCHEEIIALESN